MSKKAKDFNRFQILSLRNLFEKEYQKNEQFHMMLYRLWNVNNKFNPFYKRTPNCFKDLETFYYILFLVVRGSKFLIYKNNEDIINEIFSWYKYENPCIDNCPDVRKKNVIRAMYKADNFTLYKGETYNY